MESIPTLSLTTAVNLTVCCLCWSFNLTVALSTPKEVIVGASVSVLDTDVLTLHHHSRLPPSSLALNVIVSKVSKTIIIIFISFSKCVCISTSTYKSSAWNGYRRNTNIISNISGNDNSFSLVVCGNTSVYIETERLEIVGAVYRFWK